MSLTKDDNGLKKRPSIKDRTKRQKNLLIC